MDDSGDGMISAHEVPNWVYKLLRRDLDAGPQDVKAIARFPGGAWMVFLLLHQGTVFSSLRLAVNGPIIFRIAGIVATVASVAAGAVLVATVYTGLEAHTAGDTGFAYVRDWPAHPVGPVAHRRPGFPLRVLLWGGGEWVSRTRAAHWAVRYQSVVRQYGKGGAAPGVAADLAAQWGQALAAALPTDNWRLCGHARVVSLLALLSHAVWLLGSRPFRRPCDCLLAPAFLGLEAAASAVQAWAFYSFVIPAEACLETCRSAMGSLLAAASAILFLRVVLTHAGSATLLFTGRRTHLQLLEWQQTEARERGVFPDSAPPRTEGRGPLLPPKPGPGACPPGEAPLLANAEHPQGQGDAEPPSTIRPPRAAARLLAPRSPAAPGAHRALRAATLGPPRGGAVRRANVPPLVSPRSGRPHL
eukprot:TRINITY_DN21858_c0_g1_i10.p1 TRINITY_DN21858_c0_g1~~TRINITY_DN21858_c0_g1_i10.p1  ORF type:complete len:416 (+),score=41.23 TRINITY_DN21858_c0_g1_i10:1089-2336(+)